MRNARGSDDDRRQIIADLLSDDRSPFTPDDEQALNMARDEILRHWRDEYLKPAKSKTQRHGNCLDGIITKAELGTMVANAVAEALAGHGLATHTPKADARRAVVDEQARSMLSQLGIATPTDDQVRAVVDALMAQLDGGNGAEPGTSGGADVKAMSLAGTAEELAAEAELRGNADQARKLRKLAADQQAHQRAAATARALAYPTVARHVANADADDPEVKAMSEFNGDAAMARALANKRRQ